MIAMFIRRPPGRCTPAAPGRAQAGFTLVELVIVVVVLGVLATTALIRYSDLSREARIASLSGIASALRGTVAVAEARYRLNDDDRATTIVMEDETIRVLPESLAFVGRGGRPVSNAGGVGRALKELTGYTVSYPSHPLLPTYFLAEGWGSATCRVEYDPDQVGDPVTLVTSGC